jgi:hypothetical protein
VSPLRHHENSESGAFRPAAQLATVEAAVRTARRSNEAEILDTGLLNPTI